MVHLEVQDTHVDSWALNYIDVPAESSNRVVTADFIFALWGKGIEISQHWCEGEEARVTGGKRRTCLLSCIRVPASI